MRVNLWVRAVSVGGLLTLAAACEGSARKAEPERQLLEAKAQIMAADYRADLAELARVRDAMIPLADDPQWGYLAHYWAGFASWRLAINGVNREIVPADVKAHLEKASIDLDAAVRLRDDFADGYAAAASVNGWLGTMQGRDVAKFRELVTHARQQLARAKELAPANPRVVWVEAMTLSGTPVAYGGNPERALQILRESLEAGDFTALPASPLPDWGQPEILMSLAWGNLNAATPDLAAAADQAGAALQLQPAWFYVREILLPQIQDAQRKAAGSNEQPR